MTDFAATVRATLPMLRLAAESRMDSTVRVDRRSGTQTLPSGKVVDVFAPVIESSIAKISQAPAGTAEAAGVTVAAGSTEVHLPWGGPGASVRKGDRITVLSSPNAANVGLIAWVDGVVTKDAATARRFPVILETERRA